MSVISTKVDDSRDGGARVTHGAVAEKSRTMNHSVTGSYKIPSPWSE